jgi:hypothetical protein
MGFKHWVMTVGGQRGRVKGFRAKGHSPPMKRLPCQRPFWRVLAATL